MELPDFQQVASHFAKLDHVTPALTRPSRNLPSHWHRPNTGASPNLVRALSTRRSRTRGKTLRTRRLWLRLLRLEDTGDLRRSSSAVGVLPIELQSKLANVGRSG